MRAGESTEGAVSRGREHYPTAERRRVVRTMAAHGFTRRKIAEVLGVSRPVLLEYYREELEAARDLRERRRVVEEMARDLVPEREIAEAVGCGVRELRERYPLELARGGERRMVESAYACGVTLKEIARVLGVSEGKVRKRYRKEIEGAEVRLHAEAWGWLQRIAKRGSIEAVRALVERRRELGGMGFGEALASAKEQGAVGAMINLTVTEAEARQIRGQGDLFEGEAEEVRQEGALPLPPVVASHAETQGGPGGAESEVKE